MVHSSTNLAFCWHLAQFLEDSEVLHSKWGGEGEDNSSGLSCNGGGCYEGKRSRRQKFREQGGPSREALQRSHIVSILRQIPALHFEAGLVSSGLGNFVQVCNQVEGNGKTRCEEELSEELPGDVMWPLSAVSELGEDEIFRVDWSAVPASVDPLRGFGYKTAVPTKRKSLRRECGGYNCGGGHGEETGDGEEGRLVRGARKRSQVESIATALKFLNLPAGSVVVDFGSGSGALSLPLACLLKKLTFVCVDYKQESLRLLDMRAQAAKLTNLTIWQGRIEDYTEPFDACVALHACGHATDLALMQALRWRAGYVASPCCVGKLQFAVGASSFTGIVYDDNHNSNAGTATEDEFASPDFHNSGTVGVPKQNGAHHSFTSVILQNLGQEELESSADTLRSSREETVGLFTKAVTPKQDINENLQRRDENLPRETAGVSEHCLTYPRSGWLRSIITTDDFLLLARTADWSSYEYESWTSRLHSLCKVMVELDRNLASQELGYRTSLLSLADQKAGAIGVSHILVGKPSLNAH